MSANTSIEWTDHTFNPWWGCSKVSAGCANCYAEGVAGRFSTGNLWGKGAERKPASEKVWHDPLRWNRAAEKAGRRDLVFCASMADVFEDRRDLDAPRERLWGLIRATPWLRWLLLSKRPENFHLLLPGGIAQTIALGVSVENQDEAWRIHMLLEYRKRVASPAVIFVSAEPLLGPIDFRKVPGLNLCGSAGADLLKNLWIIAGGESGPRARPMHPDWVRGLRDQCQVAGVPFLFKQWGEWVPRLQAPHLDPGTHIQTYPTGPQEHNQCCLLAGKKKAGRLLDGREWLEFPEALRAHP